MDWDQLKDKHPKIFRYEDPSSLLSYGPPRGWLPLVDRLCVKIQDLVDRGVVPQVQAAQVKEKFRSLRFYYDPYNELVDYLVGEAEEESLGTCQSCSARVKPHQRGGGTGATMCSVCYSEAYKKYSVFLTKVTEEDWVASNEHCFAFRDAYPVSPGHTLIVPRRALPAWWDLEVEEQHAIMDLLNVVKADLQATNKGKSRDERIMGYNIGWNDGTSAGQTVSHFHLHVIPRYYKDVDDPRGGVRFVIPEKGNYKVPGHIPTLTKKGD